MKPVFLVAMGLVLSTGTVSIAQSWKNVGSKDAFVAAVQGKTLTSNGGSAKINADGTTTGALANGQKYAGKWVWDNGRYCRNLRIGNKDTGTLCAKIDVAGNQIRFSNQGGNNSVSVWSAK